MKVAFLSANREVMPDAVIPVGLLYVMGACGDRHEKVLWDLCFEPDPHAYLRRCLAAFQPDVIAFGMRNIQNNDYSGIADNMAFYRELLATLRQHTDAVIVMGGGGFSVMPQDLMRALQPDYGISGEGEASLPLLLDALDRGSIALDHVPNLHYFLGGEVRSTPGPAKYLDMDDLPVPDRSLVDRRYYGQYGIDSVQTKRGCPLRCDYCTYPIIEGKRNRTRDPALVADEVLSLRRLQPDVRHFFIVDSVFNLPPRHAKQVCRELAARGNDLPWTCYANPLGFDAELAGLMAEAGCVGMEIGSDSGCDDILDKLQKGFDTAKIRRIKELSVAAGLKDCHTFILGTPGETLDHVHRTLDFIVDLDPFSAILMVWIDDTEAIDPALRRERLRLREQILGILEDRKAQYPRWIMPPLSVNFDRRLFAYLRRQGLAGPLWQHIHLVDRRRAVADPLPLLPPVPAAQL